MPKKYEHIVKCPLSKRQRYLYDDFMSRAKTQETLEGGNLLVRYKINLVIIFLQKKRFKKSENEITVPVIKNKTSDDIIAEDGRE